MTDQRSLASTVTVSGDYDDSYYGDYGGGHLGLPYTYEEPHWQRFFGGIADELVALFAPASSYDAGCAKGFLVRALAERGVDARGGDISTHAIEGAPDGLRERLEVKDLTVPFDHRYDLVSCIEVLEHMAAAEARLAVKNLCGATDLILMSSTPEDFGEPTHINVRQPADWAKEFAGHGFFRRTDVDASFVAPWAVVFARSSPTAVAVVGAYESLLAPLNREVVAKRRALLEAQRDLTEARSPVNRAIGRAIAERDAMIAERDAVIAERGELEAHLERLGLSDLNAERMNRLAMADELVGLRAELAQVKVHAENEVVEAGREAERLRQVLATNQEAVAATSAELDAARRAVGEVKASSTWRIGRVMMTPVRLARLPRRLLRALGRRVMGRPRG